MAVRAFLTESFLEDCQPEDMKLAGNITALLIAAGPAVASNNLTCLDKVVSLMIEDSVTKQEIWMAKEVGETVKSKPVLLMTESIEKIKECL